MNQLSHAEKAYAPTFSAIRTDRSVEAQLVTSITAKIKSATSFPMLAEAIHQNRQLWMTLATSVADKDNSLEPDLRASIFYLAEFTEHHSKKVLQGAASPQALIEINMAVINGLNGKGAQ